MFSGYLNKVLNLPEVVKIREALAFKSQKLVFTNGCFDLLHPGHLRYLAEARLLGDYLLVGLNSDDSVRRLKGPTRPVRAEMERAEMLAALSMVDGVTIFLEDTPFNLIEILKPDILVKGGDWEVDDIIGGPETIARGGQVFSLLLASGFSTTSLIDRIIRAQN